MRPTPLIAAAFLAGCSYVNPVTLARMAQMSPLTTDPADLAVVVALPEGLAVRPGSARLVIHSARSDTGESLREAVVLEVTEGTDGTWFAVPESDLDRLRAAQARVRAWEEAAPEANSGGITAQIAGCAPKGEVLSADAVYSVMIGLKSGGPMMSLVRNAPVKSLLDEAGAAEFTSCLGD